MGFDIKAYSEAMDDFLVKMEKIKNIPDDGMGAALEKICRVLRVGFVHVLFTEPSRPGQPAKVLGDDVLFRDGEYEPENKYEFSADSGDCKNALYTFAGKKGEPDWDEEELNRIKLVADMLYVFNGRARAMQIAEYLTYHDKDFGFRNLSFLLREMGRIIGQRKITRYDACFFNLRSFGYINRILGREKANEVMVKYIKELQAKLPGEEYVVRVGGDNFCTLFYKEHLEAVREHLSGVGIPYDESTGEKVRISATSGFYSVPETGVKAPTDIMDGVSVALSVARTRKETAAFYNDTMAINLREKKEIEDIFPDAIKNEEFEVYYQPKVSLKNYRLAGAEALCRWFHNGEMVMPYKFIPVLEQTRAITVLDFYMLEHVCRDIRRWLDEGRTVVKVSVNLSRRHLGDMYLLEHIMAIVDKYDVPHKYIEIELTETTTDVDFRDLRAIVTGLQEQGISTSVDDFGMGYSSLNLIRELPWNVLKIDKNFLDENQNRNSAVMLKHVIAMAQEMGLECIAEGVETAEQVRHLKTNKCFLAQGFYFDRPLPKPVFEERLDGLAM